MQAFVSFIDKIKKLESVALITENEDTNRLISALLRHKELLEIHIYSSDKVKGLEFKRLLTTEYQRKGRTLPSVSWSQYCFDKGIQGDDKKYDLVFFDSNTNYQTVKSLKNFTPQYLCGRIWTDYVPYFDVWESFREIAQNIYLQVINASKKIETLEWHKDLSSETEISVVFPVYKVAEYLPKCIETATAWQAPYIEFLFVNDGSPDQSRDIILNYQKTDPRIKLIDKENGGCASARKKGMECAAGKYIGFFDPDDFIHPDMYKNLFRRALLGNYDVCYCGYKEYYESTGAEKNVVPDAILEPYVYGTMQKDTVQQLIMYARVAIWRGIYNKSFLTKNHITFYDDLKRFDDLPFKVEVFACADSVVTLPEYLYYYRLQRPGQDVSCTDERLYVHFDIFKHLDWSISAHQDQRLIDYLQIVKFQTHQYAYDRIDSKYARFYYEKMMADLKKNMGKARTSALLKQYLGKHAKREYLLLTYHLRAAYKFYRKLLDQSNLRKEAQMQKSKEQLNNLR